MKIATFPKKTLNFSFIFDFLRNRLH
jgi:hypothetical protein